MLEELDLFQSMFSFLFCPVASETPPRLFGNDAPFAFLFDDHALEAEPHPIHTECAGAGEEQKKTRGKDKEIKFPSVFFAR